MKTKTKSIVLTKSGSFNKNVASALLSCRFDEAGRKIYTGYYNGSGKWATRASAQSTVISILIAQNYGFDCGNDAPKGGITGEYVKVSRVAFNFMMSLLKM